MKPSIFSRNAKPDPELLALKEELQTAQGELAVAYRQFNQAVDPELVESCVYQISAVKARCNYLIRAIKARSPEALAAANNGQCLAHLISCLPGLLACGIGYATGYLQFKREKKKNR